MVLPKNCNVTNRERASLVLSGRETYPHITLSLYQSLHHSFSHHICYDPIIIFSTLTHLSTLSLSLSSCPLPLLYSYMSPERIKCAVYSFEVDFWSLAITLIVAVTGNHPYPVTGGLYNIMKAIMDLPQPQLPTTFPTSSDLEDFLKCCLNAPARDVTTADTLLQHPFIVSAIQRGILSNDKQVVLSPPPQPIRMEVGVHQYQYQQEYYTRTHFTIKISHCQYIISYIITALPLYIISNINHCQYKSPCNL